MFKMCIISTTLNNNENIIIVIFNKYPLYYLDYIEVLLKYVLFYNKC